MVLLIRMYLLIMLRLLYIKKSLAQNSFILMITLLPICFLFKVDYAIYNAKKIKEERQHKLYKGINCVLLN